MAGLDEEGGGGIVDGIFYGRGFGGEIEFEEGCGTMLTRIS